MTRLAVIVLVWAAGASAQARFRWEIPEELGRAEVPGTQIANGIPVRLEAVRSRWKADALFEHFKKSFVRAGLFVPPTDERRQAAREPMITGLDPATKVSFTVILQSNADGTTTCLLGEAHSAEKVPTGDAPVPVFPAAEGLVRTEMEGGRMVGYRAQATPAEVQRFYREVLQKTGYAEEPKGTFTNGAQVLKVRVGKTLNGKVPVTVLLHGATQAPERPYSPPGEAPK